MTTSLNSTESSSVDNFFTGDKAVETKEIAVKVVQNIAALEVPALESTTGKYVTYAEGGSNGTNVAALIATYAIDATSAELNAQAYSAGSFNPNALVFSGTPSELQIANMFGGSNAIVLQKPQG